MTQSVELCSKCRGEMESGYLVDRSHGRLHAGQWARGIPQQLRWFFGPISNAIKEPMDSDLVPVHTHRCKSCGFLESYARAEFAAK